MELKPPKFLRRLSECTPLFIRNHHRCGFDLIKAPATELISKAFLVSLVYVDDPGLITQQFIKYYENIGVDLIFLVLSNAAALHISGLSDSIVEHPRIAIACVKSQCSHSLDASISQIAHRFCIGKWVLICNQYEYPYYPYCESRSLRSLLVYQDSLREKSLGSLTIDCHGTDNFQSVITCPRSFADASVSFVSAGYLIEDDFLNDSYSCSSVIRNYVDLPFVETKLARTALVKWRRHYSTKAKATRIVPRQRNHVFGSSKVHIALLSSELWIKSHKFDLFPRSLSNMICSLSSQMQDWTYLAEKGLLNPGEWSK
jgi:hypothetical protein